MIFDKESENDLSRQNPPNSQETVPINEDISFIERIENYVTMISDNCNRHCPFCQGYVELKKSNLQNISAYFSRSKQKYYLTHLNCYLKSSNARIRSLSDAASGKCFQLQNPGFLDTSNYLRSDRRTYLATIEGYHPLNSHLFFRIDKTCFSLEPANHGDQLLYLNLSSKSTSIFEPNLFLIPYNEFRCVITVYLTQSLDEPCQLEFLIDLSEHKLNAETKVKNLEVIFKNQEGNAIKLGLQLILDQNNEIISTINYRIPLPEGNPNSPTSKNDLNRSTFVVLKYLMVDLPLKRATSVSRVDQQQLQQQQLQQQQQLKQVDPKQVKVNNPPQLSKWNHSDQLDEFSSAPNSSNKQILNPNAPHFNFQFQPQGFVPGPQFQQQSNPEAQFGYYYDDGPQSDEADDDDTDDPSFRVANGFRIGSPGPVERSQSGNALSNVGGNPDIPRFNSITDMPGTSKPKQVNLSKRPTNFSVTSNSSEGTSPNITPQQTQMELPSVGSMERILFGDEKFPEDALESFKLEDYKGKLVEFSKTHNGSRILQKFYPRANQQEIDMAINELSGSLEEIMLDPYANYMFQTLAQSCSSEQRYVLLQKIAPLMPRVACDRKGTHSLQALISIINRDEEEKLIEEKLSDHVLMLSKDPQATHFIQKLVNSISLAHIDFIFNAVVREFLDLANHSYGLCVLKALITKIQKQEDKKWLIIQLVSENVDNLIQNPYGNYAIQHTFETFKDDCYMIWNKIIDKVFQLSNQKFSSNVIERCLTTSNEENKKKFIAEVIKSERIVELMKNKYGNFVLLKIFNVADETDKVRLLEALQRYVNSVHVNKYKNRWLTFLEENKAYLKNSTKTMRYTPGNAFYPGSKGDGMQQPNIGQIPDTSGGNSYRANTNSFSGQQFQGFVSQGNQPGFNQYVGQGYVQNQGQGYNQGFNQSFSGNNFYPQQNMTQTIGPKKQQSIGGGFSGFPEYQPNNMYPGYQQQGGVGGGFPYDTTTSNTWGNPTNAGFPQANFPLGTTQPKKPLNYGGDKIPYTSPNFFDNQKKF